MRIVRTTMGISVDACAVSIVRVHRGRVVWKDTRLLSDGLSPWIAIASLLAEMPARMRTKRLHIIVALGPSLMQLRRLSGLPTNAKKNLQATMVAENASRFFFYAEDELRTSGVAQFTDGTHWAAAVERSVLTHIADACRSAGLEAVGVVPIASVLAHSATEGTARWRDGHLLTEADFQGELLASVRTRQAPAGEAIPHPQADDCFSAALGAARALRRDPLVITPTKGNSAHPNSLRIGFAAAAFAASVLTAVALPGLRAARAEPRVQLQLNRLSSAYARALRGEQELARKNGLLSAIVGFEGRTPSMTMRLAALTRTIAAPTRLVSFQADSAGGALVAITPDPKELLRMLDSSSLVARVAIVGPVVPEARLPQVTYPVVPGRAAAQADDAVDPMERITVRFAWKSLSERPVRPAVRKGTQ